MSSVKPEVLRVEVGRGIHVIDHAADVGGVGPLPHLQGSFDWRADDTEGGHPIPERTRWLRSDR
jgi:hypothetical protein